MRLVLAVVVLALVWGTPTSEAHAAPIGMCSEEGQSVAAPPPIRPSSDAVMTACDAEDAKTLTGRSDGRPVEQFAPSQDSTKVNCILPHDLGRVRAGALTLSVERSLCLAADEHRKRGLRPPIG